MFTEEEKSAIELYFNMGKLAPSRELGYPSKKSAAWIRSGKQVVAKNPFVKHRYSMAKTGCR